jgi:hypothetical protein
LVLVVLTLLLLQHLVVQEVLRQHSERLLLGEPGVSIVIPERAVAVAVVMLVAQAGAMAQMAQPETSLQVHPARGQPHENSVTSQAIFMPVAAEQQHRPQAELEEAEPEGRPQQTGRTVPQIQAAVAAALRVDILSCPAREVLAF